MTSFDSISFSSQRAEADLGQFKRLLDMHSRTPLRERERILPFFQSHRQVAALIGRYNFKLITSDQIAFEFDIFGDHKADLVVGDSRRNQYCFIEFEDGAETSVFKKSGKATSEWSPRFDHGFNQIIDWIYWFDNQRGTAPYLSRFGVAPIQFVAVLVIGRDRFLEKPLDRERLVWRSEHVIVASRKVNCITYDQLYRDLSDWLKLFG
jgi:Shedu protein SduA, C-terminal